MQPNLKDILIQVLNLISFEDDKEAYANEFVEFCRKQALVNTLQMLPEDQQKALNQKYSGGMSKEESERLVLEYMGTEAYQEELKKSVETTFGEFLDTLTPKMNEEQKKQIQTYFASLATQNNTSSTTA